VGKSIEGRGCCGGGHYHHAVNHNNHMKELVVILLNEQNELTEKRVRANTAQECYLQCLAVECGEGECGEAIRTKFKLNNSPDHE